MKSVPLFLLSAAICAAASLPAVAQRTQPVVQAAAKAGDVSEGEVRKVDVEARRITLKHGPLKNLGMPGMTMSFLVGDPAMLRKVKVGEKVRFIAAEAGGRLTITQIETAR